MKKFSLVVLYSTDRLTQLKNSLACWSRMTGYNDCEKILVTDGDTNIHLHDWKILEIPRQGDYYCWSHTLNEGVQASRSDFIFYLDSDRILSLDFFSMSIDLLREEKCFVYPKRTFNVNTFNISATELEKLCVTQDASKLIEAKRTVNPLHLGQLNPFSGCTGMHRDVFLSTGGYDSRYIGPGPVDTDYLMNITSRGFPIYSVSSTELHQKHSYSIPSIENKLCNIWNTHQYILNGTFHIR